MSLKGNTSLDQQYDDLKIFGTFDPRSIMNGIESYFSSHLYEFSFYNYFCNLNAFVINNKLHTDYIIPQKDKEFSKYLHNKIVCQHFYPDDTYNIVKHTNNFLSNIKDKIFVDYFVEITFPNIFGNFISDDLCEKGFDFLEGFHKLKIPLEKNILFTGLISKFIRSDMNFQYCMFDSFNSLYSIDARHKQEKYIDCLKEAARYSFSLLNSPRIQALRKISQQKQLYKNVIIDIISKVINSWKYDSFYICYKDGNLEKLSSDSLAKIFNYVKDVINEENNAEYQQSKIGLFFSEKQVLPIILTKIDLMLIDQIFIEAEIQPLYYQNQSIFGFNIAQAFSFSLHHQSFIENGQPFTYDAQITGNSPKLQSYFKFREECISKSLNPIEEKRRIGNEKINEINSQKSWSKSRIDSEIAQVKNNYKFALEIEISICNKHSTFQKKLNAYANKVFKNNMIGIKCYLNQIIHWICCNLSENIQDEKNINELISNEMKHFLEMNAPSSISSIPEQFIVSARDKNDYKNDEFYIFIQKEFFKCTNKNEIVPLNDLTENKPLMICLTQLRQSLFLNLESKFELTKEIEDNADIDKFLKSKDQYYHCNNFVKLLIDSVSKIDPSRIMICTFIEIFHIRNIKSMMVEYFNETKKNDPSKFQRFLKNYRKSQEYYKSIKDKIPDDFDDVFSFL